MSRKLIVIGLGVVSVTIAAGTWRMHVERVHSLNPITDKVLASPPAPLPPVRSIDTSSQILRPAATVDPREARKKAKDYRELVNLLLPQAKAGSAVAQYEVASALHYCEENWHARVFSRATGAVRTPDELHQLYAKLPANTQSLLNDADQRCQSFLSDLGLLNTSNDWLDQAVEAGYPPATFMKADLLMKSHLLDGDVAEIEKAREQAIIASTSADPDVLFGMADFVDSAGKSREQAGQLISAWWLLACKSGYDCGPNSDAIKGTCTVDPQCANNASFVENLERTNGAKFGDVQQLAEQIGAAIESHDPEQIKKYL
jgi:hypothetical protein